jgi:hypothetical protein
MANPHSTAPLCACGCGQRTSFVQNNDRSHGLVAGTYRQWIRGHNHRRENHPQWKGGRFTLAGYTRVLGSDGSYVAEHITVAEAALGHQLPTGAVVHHRNHDRSDNRNDNLVICQDRRYHALLHARMRARAACGHADWRKCQYCKRWDSCANLMKTNISGNAHRDCRNAYTRGQRKRLNRKHTEGKSDV